MATPSPDYENIDKLDWLNVRQAMAYTGRGYHKFLKDFASLPHTKTKPILWEKKALFNHLKKMTL